MASLSNTRRPDLARVARQTSTPPRRAVARKSGGPSPDTAPGGAGSTTAAPASIAPAYLQARLAMSCPGDASEQQADRVATQVARSPRASAPPGSDNQPLQGTSTTAGAASQSIQRASLAPGAATQTVDEIGPVPAAREIQRRPAPASATPGELQRDAQGDTGTAPITEPAVAPGVEERIQARLGRGAPLQDSARADMQARFGQDFGQVHIHTDAEAVALCAATQARAFTVGNDVFFASGEFAPDSDAGRELLAHELTHVVQQGGAAARMVCRKPETSQIARAGGSRTRSRTGPTGSPASATAPVTAPADDNHFDINHAGTSIHVDLEPTDRKVTFDKLPIPPFKVPYHSGIITREAGSAREEAEENDAQRTSWMAANNSQAIQDVVASKINATTGHDVNAAQTYILKQAPAGYNQQEQRYIGTQPSLSRSLTIPGWDSNGRGRWFQVDHKKELQLGGSNDPGNLQLLNQATNRNSGFSIRRTLRSLAARVGETERAAATAQGRETRDGLSNADTIMSGWTMVFSSTVGDPQYNPQDVPSHYKWEASDIAAGQHLRVPGLTLQAEDPATLGDGQRVMIFPFSEGGIGKRFQNQSAPASGEADWWAVAPWQVVSKNFLTAPGQEGSAQLGSIELQLPSNRVTESHAGTVSITRVAGAPYAGTLSSGDFVRNLGNMIQVQRLSPVHITSLTSGPSGLEAHGEVLPTLPLFRGSNLEFEIQDGAFRVFRAFSGPDIHLPSPLQVNESTLTIGMNSATGLEVVGRADIEIERLGRGYLGASASTGAGFALEGGFDFDSELFDRAHVEAAYRDGNFSASGDIGIDGPNKIRGIQSANLHVDYRAGQLSADGTVEPNIPGVQQAGMRMHYSEQEGLTIGGTLQLAPNPAIRSGSIDVTVNKLADVWRVAATGTAQPAIPGIDSTLTVSYDDGAFDASFNGAFRRGMLAGTAEVGATNRSLDADGQPTGAPEPGAALIVYGGGSATLQIAPWLQGTASMRFAPDGEVTVSGEIGLPGALEIFPRQAVHRPLFDMATQIPVFPGIVAEVGGNLGASAGIGPGALDRLSLHIDYNPAHEDDTHVTGDAHLNVPADAGLRLGARAGIGLGITGASATGGLELGGSLGVTGAAEAGIHIDWSPAQGLVVDAEGALHAEPRFRFDVSGYVSVRALGFSVYDNRWELAAYELGSNLRLGVRFPIHYEDGQPFAVSLDDVVFEVPDVDPAALVRDLGARVISS
ncbi:MAG: hypothetical protein RL375_3435 [Pseudomonadota bacterium]